MKKNKLKQHKQSLKQHKTARRYRSTHVNNLELKTCENNINIFSNILILCGNLQCKLPLQNFELNQTRLIFSSSLFFVHLVLKIVFCHIVPKIQISSSSFNHFRTKLDEMKIQLVSLSSTGWKGQMTKIREHFFILKFCLR